MPAYRETSYTEEDRKRDSFMNRDPLAPLPAQERLEKLRRATNAKRLQAVQVLREKVLGKTNEQIAAELKVGVKTVATALEHPYITVEIEKAKALLAKFLDVAVVNVLMKIIHSDYGASVELLKGMNVYGKETQIVSQNIVNLEGVESRIEKILDDAGVEEFRAKLKERTTEKQIGEVEMNPIETGPLRKI